MPQATSSELTEVINEALTSSITAIVQNCSASLLTENTSVQIATGECKNYYNSRSKTQYTLNQSCSQAASSYQDFYTKVSSQVQQAITQDLEGGLFDNETAISQTIIENIISYNITDQTLQDVFNSIQDISSNVQICFDSSTNTYISKTNNSLYF